MGRERTSRRSSSRDSGRDSGRSSGRSSKGGFQYKARGREAIDKRANQSAFDNGPSLVKGDIPVWRPNDGNNTIRILPPTWDDAEHFGMDVYVHYQVGADKESYLALHENLGEDDPIYEERVRAEAEGETNYAKKLKAKKRTLYFIIDRDHEDKGVQAWFASWTIDKDINAICVHKRSGEIYQIDDPENGYDISFEKTGKGLNTEYKGFQLDRRESDLGEEEWLEFAVDNPLPEILNYVDYETIDKAFAGGAAVQVNDSDDSKRGDDKDSKRGRDSGGDSGRDSGGRSEGDYVYDEVLAMDFPDLEDIIDEEGLDIDPGDYKDDEAQELAEDILKELGIKKPAPKRSSRRRGRSDSDDSDSDDKKVSNMRSSRRSRR